MEETKKAYYDELNIFRALLVFWVVVGHSFDDGASLGGFLHTYAYTFHMNAFFVLSGILFCSKLDRIKSAKDMGLTVLDRAKRLLVPYFFYSAVSYVLKFFLEKYANNSLSKNIFLDLLLGTNNPNGGLWFLHSLFLLSVIAIILYKVPRLITFIAALAVFLSIPFIPNIPEALKPLMLNAVYFFFGLFIAKYYGAISKSVCEYCKSRRALTTVITVFYISFTFFAVWGIKLLGIKSTNYKSFLILSLVTVLNTVVCYLTAHLINSAEKIKPPFMTVGNYGMDIYLIGYYIQIAIRVALGQMLGAPYAVYATLMLIFGLLLPIPISKYIIRKFRLTSALMLGVYPKKDKK